MDNSIYSEKHHILPKSLGGENNQENIIKLSSKEHFICHYLLTKSYDIGTNEWYKMNHAFMLMTASRNGKRYINSRLYEASRKNYPKVMSHSQLGTKNSQYGTVCLHNLELEKNIRIKTDTVMHYLSLGYNYGHVYNWSKKKTTTIKISQIKLEKQKKTEERANHLFNIYKNKNYQSLTEFIIAENYTNSKVALTKLWKKYVPEFNQTVKQGVAYVAPKVGSAPTKISPAD